MSQQTYTIRFEGISPAEANLYASELRDTLLDVGPDITVDQKRDNTATQDFGATLVLILGTSAVTAIATAIGEWIKLHHSTTLTIEDADGRKYTATNVSGKASIKTIQDFLEKK